MLGIALRGWNDGGGEAAGERDMRTAGRGWGAMLNDLETICLSLLAQGHSRTSIAERAGVSRTAVAGLIEAACGKLGARNTLHAVARACQLDLLTQDNGG